MAEKLEARAARLAAVDGTTLTPLVQRALGSERVEVIDWACEQLHGGIAAGTAIYRFSGQGRDAGQTVPWSLILKMLRPEGGSAGVSAWDCYKREAHAYQSGWLDDLPGGLAAPRCFGVVDHADGTCWMWLEEIRDRFAAPWPLEQYGVAARHLGQFNGAYLVDRRLPRWSWLSSDWLRGFVQQSAPAMESLRDAQALPWGRRWLPEEDCDRFFRLWEERGFYLDALDRLPQTICHFDIFSRNLFARTTADGDDQTVVIDWAFVGRGAIGADLSTLVWMSAALGGVGLDRAQVLKEIVMDGYLEGLRQAGWRGDAQQVRLGYAAACVRYLFPEIERWLALIRDESLHPAMEQSIGVPMVEVFHTMCLQRRHHFRELDDARKLMAVLG
jgi:hypothetical protein